MVHTQNIADRDMEDSTQLKLPSDQLLKRLFGVVILLNLFFFIGLAMWFV